MDCEGAKVLGSVKGWRGLTRLNTTLSGLGQPPPSSGPEALGSGLRSAPGWKMENEKWRLEGPLAGGRAPRALLLGGRGLSASRVFHT